jgi:hypothetical protein
MADSKIRDEVMAHLVASIRESGYDATRRAFPDVPVMILAEADTTASSEECEAWWQSIEKTIDGEIIKNALASNKA